ncbi:MAG: YegP family protein [Actinomycetota bacterium]|nr:YegP family protein [Actinomycetota bacterium]
MAGHFEIETRSDGQFMFNLKVGSDAILTSEAYTTKAACINGIESVKKNAPDLDRYRRTATPEGKFRFALDAANGEAIGASAYFDTSAARDDSIEFVMKNAPDAEVKDLS